MHGATAQDLSACIQHSMLNSSFYTSQAMHMLEASFFADSKISARGCATSGKDDKASDPDAGNKQPLIAGQEGMDCTGSI